MGTYVQDCLVVFLHLFTSSAYLVRHVLRAGTPSPQRSSHRAELVGLEGLKVLVSWFDTPVPFAPTV